MKIPIIQNLVENYTIEVLKKAEEALVAEEPLPIEVVGDDEGEQLTHIIAASWIIKKMETDSIDFKTALKEYTRKVRESIT
jgi:uncharacterized protein DUF6952